MLPVASFKFTDFDLQSEVQLGYIDDTAYAGTLTTHQAITTDDYSTWWTLSLDEITYNSVSVKTNSLKHAILDSGTSLILIPASDYSLFVEQIQSATGNMFDCGNLDLEYCSNAFHSC